MEVNEKLKATLLDEVEQRAGYHLRSTSDFNRLSTQVFETVGVTISSSTLKRLWGYVEGYDTVRVSTLDILAKFVGCDNWEAYCRLQNGDEGSFWLDGALGIAMSELQVGDLIEITWSPGRRIVASYMGQGRMRVEQSERGKLAVGDTFSCSGIVNGQPLLLTQVQHRGNMHVVNYQCGKHGGVQARKIKS